MEGENDDNYIPIDDDDNTKKESCLECNNILDNNPDSLFDEIFKEMQDDLLQEEEKEKIEKTKKLKEKEQKEKEEQVKKLLEDNDFVIIESGQLNGKIDNNNKKDNNEKVGGDDVLKDDWFELK